MTELDQLTEEQEEQLALWEAQQKFRAYSLAEATEAAEEQGDWLVPGLIGSTSTLVFGEAKVGKSWLIAHLIGALLTRGKFLDVQVPDEQFSIGIGYTDDAGHREYAKRIGTAVDGTDHPVSLYPLRIMQREDWDDLFRVFKDAGHNVLVIDNLTQILDGSMVDDDVIRQCFDGIRTFTRSDIPVVIVGHATDSPSKNGWKPNRPMGSAAISQSVRWLMQIRPGRGGNLDVKTYGNIDHGRSFTIRPGTGVQFDVVAVDTDEKSAGRNRTAQTLDKTKDQARFVIENCQGMSRNMAAQKLAENFDGAVGTHKNSLTRGRLSKLVRQAGTGWEWVEHR
ncbi:AAA family ATPase [Nocardia thraciensis]